MPDSTPLQRNQHLRTLLLFMALLVVLVMALLGYMLWTARQAAIHKAEVSTANFAKILQVRIDATMHRIDAILRVSAKSFPPTSLRTDASATHDNSEQAALTALLDDQILGFDAIAGLRVNDATGIVRYASGGLAEKIYNSADRDFFIAQRDNPNLGLFFSQATRSRITDRDVVVVSRSLRDENGKFYGIISAGITLTKLQQQFKQLNIGQNDSIFLRRLDNHQLVVRWPHLPRQVNQGLLANHPAALQLQTGAREFTLRGPAQVDQIERITSISVFEHYPFYIGVSQSFDDTLADWRRQAWQVGLSALGILLLLAGLMINLLRSQGREMRVLSELAQNQARMRLLAQVFEYSGEAIILLDMNENILEVNSTFSQLTGYRLDEVRGQSWRTLFTSIAKDHPPSLGSTPNWQGEMLCRRKDGSQFTSLNSHATMASEDEHTHYQIINFSDISERKRAEKLKSEFVSTVSHELRTPLTSINGAIGLLLGGAVGEISDKIKKLLDIAKRNGEHLASMINDLLDIEKLEAGKLNLHLETLPLMPQIEAAMEKNQAYAQQHQVNCQIIQRVDQAMVQVDAMRLQQVLLNLLSNAAKFSSRGGKIDIAVSQQADLLRVEVQDYGQGVPAEFRSTIFQKFAQADAADTRKRGGTGLGLAISKQLIEQMNGQIGFDNTVGKGACFYFTLPNATPKAN